MDACRPLDLRIQCGMFSLARTFLFFLVAIVTLAFGLPVQAHDSHLTIVFEDYPPYEYVQDNKVKGINMDITREAFKRMGVTVSFEPRPWKRALLELKQGEILALSSGFINEERLEFAIFPSEPLAMEVNVIAVKKDSDMQVKALGDLAGHSVGVVREYTYGQTFDTLKGYQRVEANSMHQLVDMLLNNRMDAMIGNRDVIRHIAKETGRMDDIKFIYEVGRAPLYLFFSRMRGKEAADLAAAFGKTIKGMHADGTFEAIQKKY